MNIVVDVEADGPCPSLYSMISFGAVALDDMTKTFYGECAPISEQWQPEALKVSGFTREQTLSFKSPETTMIEFDKWLSQFKKVTFWSDNNGFDWQFINYYLHLYVGNNRFGFSSRNIGDIYKGMNKSVYASFKHLRVTKHSHHPVDDAMGNAEALIKIRELGLILPK